MTQKAGLDLAGVRLCQGHGADVFEISVPRLSLAAGACLAISGPSGAGKTTLLEMLALLRAPAEVQCFALPGCPADLAGRLRAGRQSGLAPLRSGPIGFAPQSGALLPFLSARADASAALHLGGQNGPQALARFEALAAELGLCNALARSRAELSGGERKRVALLRAMALPRKLLLLDEPTSGLDPERAVQVMRLIAELSKAEGTVCVVTTHAPDLAAEMGFRTVMVEMDSPKAARLPAVGLTMEIAV